MRAFILVAALLFQTAASAYVPKFWMIMSKTSDNRGKGSYRMVQEVQFEHLDEPIVIIEEWTIIGDQRMFLKATGKGIYKDRFRFQAMYDGVTRQYISENGQRMQGKVPADWFEDFFWFKISDKMKVRMFNLKMIPREGLAKPAAPRTLSQVKHTPEPFVRLGRTNGKIAYVIGEPPTSPTGEVETPTLWVEQDAFNVLKIKMPTAVSVKANDYKTFAESFQFPKKREVSWTDKKVSIQTIDVKPVVSPSVNLDQAATRTFGDDPIVQEFYSRFR